MRGACLEKRYRGWGVEGLAEVCHQFDFGPQNKDEHLTLIFMAGSADGLLR